MYSCLWWFKYFNSGVCVKGFGSVYLVVSGGVGSGVGRGFVGEVDSGVSDEVG